MVFPVTASLGRSKVAARAPSLAGFLQLGPPPSKPQPVDNEFRGFAASTPRQPAVHELHPASPVGLAPALPELGVLAQDWARPEARSPARFELRLFFLALPA